MNEDQHTEWKSSWRDEHLKWICGIANAQGGMLVIGRDDKELPSKVRDTLGIVVAVRACCEAGAPEPRIEFDGRDVWVEFPFSEAYLQSIDSTKQGNGRGGRTTQETTRGTTQEQILALLRGEPELTRKVLAERVGISADGVKYHLDQLRQADRIRHVGPTKKGRWEVLEDLDE